MERIARKTFGTRYAEKYGIVNAQHLLGHADIRTAQLYLDGDFHALPSKNFSQMWGSRPTA